MAAKGKKSTEEYFEVPCLTIVQSKYRLVMFRMKAKRLWSILQINQREPDKDKGYQRALSTSRVNTIARFIDKKRALPLSILVSLKGATLAPDGRSIRIPKKKDAGWVIDGQHRLAGAKEARIPIQLPVVAFLDLSGEEQIAQFVTVNREAKGVPTSLYYDLLSHLPNSKNDADLAKERAVDIADELKRDEDSLFFGRIVVMTSPRRGELSLNNFVRKIAPLVHRNKGRLHLHTEKEQVGIINNYYLGLSNVFPAQFKENGSVFFKTLGFGALMNALPTVLDLCINHYKGFRVEDVISLLKKVDFFPFENWETMGTGTAAEAQAGDDLREELRAKFDEEGEAGSTIRL